MFKSNHDDNQQLFETVKQEIKNNVLKFQTRVLIVCELFLLFSTKKMFFRKNKSLKNIKIFLLLYKVEY